MVFLCLLKMYIKIHTLYQLHLHLQHVHAEIFLIPISYIMEIFIWNSCRIPYFVINIFIMEKTSSIKYSNILYVLHSIISKTIFTFEFSSYTKRCGEELKHYIYRIRVVVEVLKSRWLGAWVALTYITAWRVQRRVRGLEKTMCNGEIFQKHQSLLPEPRFPTSACKVG